jgi:hypothetical protein
VTIPWVGTTAVSTLLRRQLRRGVHWWIPVPIFRCENAAEAIYESMISSTVLSAGQGRSAVERYIENTPNRTEIPDESFTTLDILPQLKSCDSPGGDVGSEEPVDWVRSPTRSRRSARSWT